MRCEARLQLKPQLRMVEVSTNQHQLVGQTLVQLYPPADEVKNIAFVAFVYPEQTLGPKDAFRKPLQEILKLVDRNGYLALERKRRKAICRQMIVTMAAGGGMIEVGLVSILLTAEVKRLLGEISVRLE